MNGIFYDVVLDVMKCGCQQKISGFYNGETGIRSICITLTSDNRVYPVDPDLTLTVFSLTPDDRSFMQTCTADDGKIIYTPLSGTLNSKGDVLCQLQVTDKDGKILFTPEFILEVSETIRDTDAVESSNQYSALDEMLTEVTSLKSLLGLDGELLKKLGDRDGKLTYNGVSIDGEAIVYCNDLLDVIENNTNDIIANAGDILKLNENQTKSHDRITKVEEEIESVKSEIDNSYTITVYNGALLFSSKSAVTVSGDTLMITNGGTN